MFHNLKKRKINEVNLYNNILFLSRNKLLYTQIGLKDTFQNKINLVFIHISFIFTKINQKNKILDYKKFYQKMFDLIFENIELNMREIGYGDVIVNKNMKYLVRIFYNILLNCENYKNKTTKLKSLFLLNYLTLDSKKNNRQEACLISYFDKYCAFCLDLSHDKVLKGSLNFVYK